MSNEDKATWPGGYRCAFVLTVGFEAALSILAVAPDAADRAKSLSVGGYGAVRGVDRLLEELSRTETKATWFIPSRNLEAYPAQVENIAAAGHDFGNSGVALEDFSLLDLAGQLAVVDEAQQRFQAQLGSAPRGFRAGRGSYARGLPQALVERGFTWSSSWHGDDRPHFHAGRAATLVELPVHYELDDYPYFVFNLDPPIPKGSPRVASSASVLGNWKTEFDAYRTEGLCFVLTVHPEIIATPGRIGVLREFLDYVRSFDDVWLGTGEEVADWWRGHSAANPHEHPVEVFDRMWPLESARTTAPSNML